MMAYPAQEEKGLATALFWILFNSGAVVGGLLTLIVNLHSAPAAAPSTTTLVCFLVVMLCGTLLTALLVPPERVLRRDGRRVTTTAMAAAAPVAPSPAPAGYALSSLVFTGLRTELRAMREVVRNALQLLPLFAYSNWFYAYQFGPFNSRLFTARTQVTDSTPVAALLCAPLAPSSHTCVCTHLPHDVPAPEKTGMAHGPRDMTGCMEIISPVQALLADTDA
jgi:hypothetical protein